MRRAYSEATWRGFGNVGTELVLFALAVDDSSRAGKLLSTFGFDVEAARAYLDLQNSYADNFTLSTWIHSTKLLRYLVRRASRRARVRREHSINTLRVLQQLTRRRHRSDWRIMRDQGIKRRQLSRAVRADIRVWRAAGCPAEGIVQDFAISPAADPGRRYDFLYFPPMYFRALRLRVFNRRGDRLRAHLNEGQCSGCWRCRQGRRRRLLTDRNAIFFGSPIQSPPLHWRIRKFPAFEPVEVPPARKPLSPDYAPPTRAPRRSRERAA
jgi:Clp amino terminal domain, pathogenicity island component